MKYVKKLKTAKASGEEDGIKNEAWKYTSKGVGEVLWKLMRNI